MLTKKFGEKKKDRDNQCNQKFLAHTKYNCLQRKGNELLDEKLELPDRKKCDPNTW